MKKQIHVFLLMFFVLGASSLSAQMYKTKRGSVSFFSEALLENIEAHTKVASSVINTETGEIVAKMKIKTFQFEKSLMQEHFNENYMESETYPYGILAGTITGDVDYNTPGKYDVVIKGKLTIHGVEKERDIPGTITVAEDHLVGEATFVVKPEEHKIDIPSMVVDNIAEEIEVKVNFKYNPVEDK